MSIEKHLRRVGLGIIISPFLAALATLLFLAYSLVREAWPTSGYLLGGLAAFIGVCYMLGWMMGADDL